MRYTILIDVDDKPSEKLFLDLARKLNCKARVLTDAQKENLHLGRLMETEKTGTAVSRKAIFKQLSRQ